MQAQLLVFKDCFPKRNMGCISWSYVKQPAYIHALMKLKGGLIKHDKILELVCINVTQVDTRHEAASMHPYTLKPLRIFTNLDAASNYNGSVMQQNLHWICVCEDVDIYCIHKLLWVWFTRYLHKLGYTEMYSILVDNCHKHFENIQNKLVLTLLGLISWENFKWRSKCWKLSERTCTAGLLHKYDLINDVQVIDSWLNKVFQIIYIYITALILYMHTRTNKN